MGAEGIKRSGAQEVFGAQRRSVGFGLLVGFVGFAACARSDLAPRTTSGSTIVGTWRAVRHYARTTGLNAYVVYDATGHVFFETVSGQGPELPAVPDSLTAIFADATAYFGTYQVYPDRSVVAHHIEGEIPRRRGNLEITTAYRLRGDTLEFLRDTVPTWIFVRLPNR